MGQKQDKEELEVSVMAEAFEISVKFHELGESNLIDFGDIRVSHIE